MTFVINNNKYFVAVNNFLYFYNFLEQVFFVLKKFDNLTIYIIVKIMILLDIISIKIFILCLYLFVEQYNTTQTKDPKKCVSKLSTSSDMVMSPEILTNCLSNMSRNNNTRAVSKL